MSRRRKKEEKKKKRSVLKAFLIIITILVIGVGGFVGYSVYKNGWGLGGLLATMKGHNEETRKNMPELKMLILGVSTDLDSQLTDTIIVASYNPNTQKANLLSIPRDTYTGENTKRAVAAKKINALYNMTKDPQETLDAVNKITGLEIENYVIVRTEALIELVDAIGGVQFNVPIDMYYTDKTQNLTINLKAGEQLIDGDKAEQLLRFRHNNNGTSYPTEYGDNDFGRMRTQRDFITATLKQTLKPGNIFKVKQILEIADKNVETNMSFDYISDYLPYAVEFNSENLVTATLPGTTPNFNQTNGVSIFVADDEEAKALVQSMFFGVKEETEEASIETVASEIKIELLNGTGDTSKLAEAKTLLEEAGYNVSKTGKSSTMSKTVITNKKNVDADTLKKIKSTLGNGEITTNKLSGSSVDVTIIIGKDFIK